MKSLLCLAGMTLALCACSSEREISAGADGGQISEKIFQCHDSGSSFGIVNGTGVGVQDPDSKRAVLLIVKRGQGYASCTGAAIANQVILTAAHCLKGVTPGDVKVVFHPEMTCSSGYTPSKTIASAALLIHPKYDENDKGLFDLGLIKLASPIPADYPVQALYDGVSPLSSDRALMIGYGVTHETANDSLHLRKTQKRYEDAAFTPEKNIVFPQDDADGGACSGDSGGPIYVRVKGEHKIMAINSVVMGNDEKTACHEASMAMYLPNFASWIQESLLKL